MEVKFKPKHKLIIETGNRPITRSDMDEAFYKRISSIQYKSKFENQYTILDFINDVIFVCKYIFFFVIIIMIIVTLVGLYYSDVQGVTKAAIDVILWWIV